MNTQTTVSEPRTERFERYLGDGVYAHFDGYQIWLTTLEGHRIAMEPQVMIKLKAYETDLDAFIDELRAREARA